MSGRRAGSSEAASRPGLEFAILVAGCLVSLATAGLLVRAGMPALVSGLVLFAALTGAIAATLAIVLTRRR